MTEQIGNATLHLGDCLPLLRAMPDASVDAVVTDPPYGTHKVDWDHSIDEAIFGECLRVSRGYCLFFYSNTRLWHILGILHGLGRDTWVIPWHKPNAMGFERRFAPQWVPIVCAYRGNLPFWGKDLVTQPIVPHKVNHPTPKPVPVMRWLVTKAVPAGGTVLDPFMGSGSTGIACAEEGRRFVGIEKDANYYAIARDRIGQATDVACEDGAA